MRACFAARVLDNFGGHSGGGTPLPIPNREVKPASADGTRRATSRESRSPPIIFDEGPPRAASSSFLGGARASRASPGRVSRSRRTRSPTGGCVTNSAARPSSPNGLIV